MRIQRIIWLIVAAMFVRPAQAQHSEPAYSDLNSNREAGTAEQATAPPESFELGYYSGDLTSRRALLGDWGGSRNDLRDNGFTFDVALIQYMMHNARGGKSTHTAIEYAGVTNFSMEFDFEKMGLWDGGRVGLLAQSWWGLGISDKVDSISPVMALGQLPMGKIGEDTISLSMWWIEKDLLDKKVTLFFEKSDARLFDSNVFANDALTQFSNFAFDSNPILGPHTPYTQIMWGAAVRPTDWLTITTAMADGEGKATRTGFDTAFHGADNWVFFHEWEFDTEHLFGMPGHQRIGALFDTTERLLIADSDLVNTPIPDEVEDLAEFIDDSGLLSLLLPDEFEPRKSGDSWAIWYNFDQVIYEEPGDPDQNIGIFGRFGWSPGDANPIEAFYSIGLTGTGIIPERDHDTFALGYYHSNMSDRYQSYLGFHSEQGIEAYYDVEVYPWFHIAPDLQVIIDPGGGAGNRDVAIVYGLRARVEL